jgi:muramoyltetrapeptide carboxypeptidase
LKNAFLDPAVKGIFCTRGGYGCARLLEAFDPAVAAAHPKILVGYSDMTTLHLALLGKGLVSFWGPMPGTSCWSLFSQKHLLRALMSAEPLGPLPFMSRHRPETLRPGRAEGGLTGGTLTLLASSLGTPYAVATQGKIVFLEDVGEEPYKVDRMLTQLLAAGKLKDAAGIAVGIFTETEPKVYNRRTSLTLRDVLADRLLPLKIPVLTGLTVGHIPDQLTLPYGVRVRMDARAKTLSVIESGVA